MPDPTLPPTNRPFGTGLGVLLARLNLQVARAPDNAVPLVRDAYQPAVSTLQNTRFASSPELMAIASGRGTLGVHSDPQAVMVVQQALEDMAFAVPVPRYGVFTSATTQAIRNFQVMAGLKPDGCLGPNTLAALDRLAPSPGLKAWDPGANPGPVPSPELGNGELARMVVSVGQHRAFMFDRNGQLEKIYGVRSGREQIDAQGKVGHATQPGVKVITGKNNDPTEVSDALWPDSQGRAFGTRLLGLDDYDPAKRRGFKGPYSGQELHGTYQDVSIGRDFSHGCVGLRNQDIEEIYDQVRVGDKVLFE